MREVQSIQDVNIALRELYEFYDLFKRNSVDLNGKRFTNVGKHVNSTDFVRWDELTDQIGGLSETIRKPIAVPAAAVRDKATFGLQKLFTVSTQLTLNYICVNGGKFKYVKAKPKDLASVPTGTDAILDIRLSIDDGTTWNSILNSPLLVLPAGQFALVTNSSFAITSIAPFDLLSIDCIQIGTTYAGRNFEIVVKWE